ncbi:hypothetical protein BVX98_03675 [bacterium F11]|nr:hypothetical protein BVX98_03675 [bacterium F11]
MSTNNDEVCVCEGGKTFKDCCIHKIQNGQFNDKKANECDIVDDNCPLCVLEQSANTEDGRDFNMLDRFVIDIIIAEHYKDQMLKILKESGIRPEVIQAFERTGLLPSKENMGLFTRQDVEMWEEAIEKYRKKGDHKSQ